MLYALMHTIMELWVLLEEEHSAGMASTRVDLGACCPAGEKGRTKPHLRLPVFGERGFQAMGNQSPSFQFFGDADAFWVHLIHLRAMRFLRSRAVLVPPAL